jgi:2-oxoglutarate ferredoxin oxidoreductase subunit delta
MAKKQLEELIINREWCKGCGICVNFCPKNVLELRSEDKAIVARPEDCICCKLCKIRCPDLAIELFEVGEREPELAY